MLQDSINLSYRNLRGFTTPTQCMQVNAVQCCFSSLVSETSGGDFLAYVRADDILVSLTLTSRVPALRGGNYPFLLKW